MVKVVRAAVVLAAATAGALGLAAPSAAQEVPNDNWHSHPPGAPWLVAIAGDVVCPDATDKLLLPSAERNFSPVMAAGVCMSATHVVHLRWLPGGNAPSGWSQVEGMQVFYKLTARG
jgi:hypothetical protein